MHVDPLPSLDSFPQKLKILFGLITMKLVIKLKVHLFKRGLKQL